MAQEGYVRGDDSEDALKFVGGGNSGDARTFVGGGDLEDARKFVREGDSGDAYMMMVSYIINCSITERRNPVTTAASTIR
ncbi:hypothetical protein SLEP1_g58136 [Rubroshorea leprosula]|uniref:Uncharacterized protein n=1 Tax=Rubroshorea leprosula TaxID=152421 RepID=A0AAV5MNA6_9ROSI|nr:hypothetical protein SLEP1_g58136 [Rubroshorea leprosula]